MIKTKAVVMANDIVIELSSKENLNKEENLLYNQACRVMNKYFILVENVIGESLEKEEHNLGNTDSG